MTGYLFFTVQYLLYWADKIVDFVLPPDVLLLIRKKPDVVSRQEASTGRKKLTKPVHRCVQKERVMKHPKVVHIRSSVLKTTATKCSGQIFCHVICPYYIALRNYNIILFLVFQAGLLEF